MNLAYLLGVKFNALNKLSDTCYMTYLAFYFDKATNEIAVAQDTVVFSRFNNQPATFMDKVYHHEQSNILIGGAGSWMAGFIGYCMREYEFENYDEALQWIIEAIPEIRLELQSLAPEEFEQYILADSISCTFVFGYDEESNPKLTRIDLFGKDHQIYPTVLNMDKSIQTGLGYCFPPAGNLKYESIHEDTFASHSESFKLLDTFTKDISQAQAQLKYMALIAHLSSCHVPIAEGGIGLGVGGEYVEYRIGTDKQYSEAVLFVYPDNNLHGLILDTPRFTATGMLDLEEEELPVNLTKRAEGIIATTTEKKSK